MSSGEYSKVTHKCPYVWADNTVVLHRRDWEYCDVVRGGGGKETGIRVKEVRSIKSNYVMQDTFEHTV